MSYNDITDRSNPGGGALVPPEASMEIFKQATQMSAALSLFRRVPVLTNRTSFPVLSSQPKAYWLSGSTPTERDMAFIQTTEMAWKNVDMNVAEIAVLAPVPRRLVNDIASGGINLTEEIRPFLAQSIAQAVDQAIFFGINMPLAWSGTKSVYQGAVDAGNVLDPKSPFMQAVEALAGFHPKNDREYLRPIRALCCRQWGIPPWKFDHELEAGNITAAHVHDAIELTKLQTDDLAKLLEYIRPGTMERVAEIREDLEMEKSWQNFFKLNPKLKPAE